LVGGPGGDALVELCRRVFRGLMRLTNPKVRIAVRSPESASTVKRPIVFSLDGVAGFYNPPAPSSGRGTPPKVTVELLALRDDTVVSVMVTKSTTPIAAAKHTTDVLRHMNS
jgi:hypothetical protein